MNEPIELVPIGVVVGGRSEIFEDHWGAVTAQLALDPAALDPDATRGLEQFSHLEVLFHFHRARRVCRSSEHPRGNPAWPRVGVLAGHGPMRPNHLGVSRCELLATGSPSPCGAWMRSMARRYWTSSRTWRSSAPWSDAGTGLGSRADAHLLLSPAIPDQRSALGRRGCHNLLSHDS